MSSTAGKAGVPYSGSYTGSKHALHVSFSLLLKVDIRYIEYIYIVNILNVVYKIGIF